MKTIKRRSCCIVYAHFDQHDVVDGHVVYQLEKFNEFADHIIFVSTSKLDQHEQSKLSNFGCAVYTRENEGIDFLSWQFGLKRLRESGRVFDRIILMNDSCYGPWSPLAPLFDALDRDPSQVVSATQSVQIRHHFQSFFISYQNGIQNSPLLDEYYNSMVPLKDKQSMIVNYELPLMEWFKTQGVRTNAVLPVFDRNRAIFLRTSIQLLCALDLWWSFKTFVDFVFNKAVNPSHYNAKEMMESSFPFLKVELLRDNPRKIGLDPIYEMMSAAPPLKDLVCSHLRRIKDR